MARYRIKTHRMPMWDYSGNGYYFITLVTQNRECNLGEIVKTHRTSSIVLSDFGKIVENEWNKSFVIRNELFCDEYIIMPNHIHAIIILRKPIYDRANGSQGFNDPHVFHGAIGMQGTKRSHVEAHGRASLHVPLIRKPKSLSSFIGGFKSSINKKIDDYIDANNVNIPKYNRNNHFFQPNYHEHIIRNEVEYNRIAQYISKHPA